MLDLASSTQHELHRICEGSGQSIYVMRYGTFHGGEIWRDLTVFHRKARMSGSSP